MFKNEKVLILGFSITGTASAKYLANAGAECFLSEYGAREKFDEKEIKKLENLGVKLEFGGHSDDFIQGAKLCVTSPGISKDAPVIKKLEALNVECITDIELAFRTKKVKMLAITGTNGKTTSTMLASHVLNGAFNAPYCGNIGVSPCDYLNSNADYLVTEVSSFQLEYSPSFAPKIAIYTNFTPDHISWHGSEELYFDAKAKMFLRMDENAHAILNFEDKKLVELSEKLRAKVHFFSLNEKKDAFVSNGAVFYKGEKIVNVDELPILGPHNLQNVMGVVIMAKLLGMNTEDIKSKLLTFKAPPHRCEFVANVKDTAFYNDSKATNPEATIVAISAFKGKKVSLIVGGRDKNTTLEEFCKVANETIHSVIVFGEGKDRFREALLESGFKNITEGTTLEDAVDKAIAQEPDVVLFSPACASFDMFKNYEERGEAFRSYVLSKR